MTTLYLDSADPAEWAEAMRGAMARRVTSNPLLMRAAGRPVTMAGAEALWSEARHLGLEELHLQAWPDAHGDWLPVAQALAALSPHVVVKLPAVRPAMVAAAALKREGARVLVTAVSNPVHGLWAHEIGADFVAPYVGRLAQQGRDIPALLSSLVALQARGGPRVLAASVRDLDTLGWLLTLGVGAVTLRKTLLDEALGDAATIQAVAQFEEATRPGAPARGA
jgi:transaldolase